jgi:pimeloyl-ACP methyl ester carboxylesterase
MGPITREAVYFPARDYKLFGWLHYPAHHSSDTGLVICKPFGYEAICGHRTLRAFAEMAATAGFPTLRFDYLGTGDSADIDAAADQIEAWCGDILAAVEEVRRRTGVRRVSLLGFRLGALLATLVARSAGSVHSLILVAPVISGRRYMGEMRTTHLAAQASADARVPAGGSARNRATVSDGSIEVSGHSVSAATISKLMGIDPATLGAPPVSQVLIIDRSDLPAARTWAESLSNAGVSTQYLALPGFVEMMMTAPQFARIPQEMIAVTCDWLRRSAPLQAPTSPGRGDLDTDRETAVFPAAVLSLPASGSEAGLSERPVQFGVEASLLGIVTEPRPGENRGRAVILVNAGGDYHICVGRLYVSLARCWARSGYIVLRMDLAGLGDSDTRPGRPDNDIFPPEAVDDILAGISLLQRRYQIADITVAGLCSGAYHALQAAIRGLPLDRILLVNPENFFPLRGATLKDVQPSEAVTARSVYGERVRSFRYWKKVLMGQVDVSRIMTAYSLRFRLSLTAILRDILRHVHIHLPNDLSRQLERIAARGVQTAIVFGRGEPGIELLRIEGGSALRRLGQGLRVHIIDGADHMFSRAESRAILVKTLSEELFTASACKVTADQVTVAEPLSEAVMPRSDTVSHSSRGVGR